MTGKSAANLAQFPCVRCVGRGYSNCSACGGAGHTFLSKSRLRYDRTLEFYQERLPCTGCFGTGRIMCLSCKGVGWVLQEGTAPPRSDRSGGRATEKRPVRIEPPAVSTGFAFKAYEFVYHPANQEVWACWQHNPGNCLDVGAPGAQVRIDVAACQRETWLSIRDESGNLFPLSMFVCASGALLGKWM